LKELCRGFCLYKNQEGRGETKRIEYGVPRIVAVSNTKDGAVYVIDMKTLEIAKKLDMGTGGGAGQVLNTYTNYFELAGMPTK